MSLIYSISLVRELPKTNFWNCTMNLGRITTNKHSLYQAEYMYQLWTYQSAFCRKLATLELTIDLKTAKFACSYFIGVKWKYRNYLYYLNSSGLYLVELVGCISHHDHIHQTSVVENLQHRNRGKHWTITYKTSYTCVSNFSKLDINRVSHSTEVYQQ